MCIVITRVFLEPSNRELNLELRYLLFFQTNIHGENTLNAENGEKIFKHKINLCSNGSNYLLSIENSNSFQLFLSIFT